MRQRQLSDTTVRKAKPKAKPYKLADSGGLYLLVAPNGSRHWRLKYRFDRRADGNGFKEKSISLGAYPEISLAEARESRDEGRKLLAKGINPSGRVGRSRGVGVPADSLKSNAEAWLSARTKALAEVTIDKKRWMLEAFIYPKLGDRPINALTAPELLAALRAIEVGDRHETAHRTLQLMHSIIRWAIAEGRAERNVASDIRGLLAPVVTTNRAAIVEPARVGELLRAIDGYQGEPSATYALRIAPYVFLRPGELRAAEWKEFDIDRAEWRVPAERMKMRRLHVVPLSEQVAHLLGELHTFTGRGRLLFPSLRTNERCISENTLNAALRRLGFRQDEHCAHGFRSTASTLLNELGWDTDLIELQLAHAEKDKVRAAYNRAQRLADRRKMMQAWADYLDGLRAGPANVVSIGRGKAA